MTRAILYGMDVIVEDMRRDGGDAPVGDAGFELTSGPVIITVFAYEAMAQHFTRSIAASVLRGTWDLMAGYGFYTVHMEIFIGTQAPANHAGQILIESRPENGTVASSAPQVTGKSSIS